MAQKCAPLLSWFKSNGGTLHPSLDFTHDADNGYHFVARDALPSDSTACVCPFPLTLSHQNVSPDAPSGARSYHQTSACSKLLGKVDSDVVAHFLLIEERLKSVESFWSLYIDALPKEDELTTPLYFTPEDLVWLYGTQQYNKNIPPERTAVGLRLATWQQNWKAACAVLKSQADTSKYTWELYKWAATIFSSRSFTSRIYDPTGEPYPVLFPVLDCFNHRFASKVLWNMAGETERGFSLVMLDGYKAGDQVYNNYAPKGNDELLLGYGFAIQDNPCDEVGMRMAQPPPIIHESLMQTMPFHFKSKEFDPTEFVFHLRGSKHYAKGYRNRMRDYGVTCMRGVSEEFALTLQMYTSYQVIPESKDKQRQEGELWYATCDMFLSRLRDVRQQIRHWDNQLPDKPQNKCQEAGRIYREGQLAILDEVISEFEVFLEPLDAGVDYMTKFGRLVQDQYFRTYH